MRNKLIKCYGERRRTAGNNFAADLHTIPLPPNSTGQKKVTLEGKVVKLEMVNPHSWIHFDVTNARRQGRALEG